MGQGIEVGRGRKGKQREGRDTVKKYEIKVKKLPNWLL